MKPRTAKVLKWLGWVVLGLAVVYITCLLLSGMALRRARAELLAAGRPMQAAAVIPPEVADTDNAAPLYTAAVQLLKAEPCTFVKSAHGKDLFEVAAELGNRVVSRTISPADQVVFEALLQHMVMREATGILERAIAKPQCRFPVDWTKGPGILLPHLSTLRLLSRIWAAKAISEARQGKAAEAWESVRQGLAMAGAVKTEPTLISQFVRMAQISLALEAMTAIQKQAAPDAATAVALIAALKSCEDTAPLVTAMDAERLLMGEWLFSLSVYSRPSQIPCLMALGDGPTSTLPLQLYASPLGLPLWQWDHAAYLRMTGHMAQAMATPGVTQDAKVLEATERSIARCFVITRMLIPALAKVKARQADFTARLRLACCGLALLQARAVDGSFPKDLAALATAGVNTADPFSAKPFLYRTADHGFVIYSVGENLQDDGGQPPPPPAPPGAVSNNPLDTVWSYAPAAAR